MFKKLVLMLSLVACTGLNAVAQEEASESFGSKVKRVLWTDRSKKEIGFVAAFLAYVGFRICVANKKLGAATLVDKIGELATSDIKCMKCLNPAKLEGGYIEKMAKGLVGYNSTIPFVAVKVDSTCPYLHLSKS